VDGRGPGPGRGAPLKLRVVAVGKLRDEGLRGLCDDYKNRIRRYVNIDEVEVKDERSLLAKIAKGAWLIALDPREDQPTSTELARKLSKWLELGRPEVSFVIGGAEGLPEDIEKRADERLSLSRLTLPHRIARLVLFEQLYRGFSILRNEPYARED
jgi:23S rRNA (pseudouridine1915-N3)-methyltransferase